MAAPYYGKWAPYFTDAVAGGGSTRVDCLNCTTFKNKKFDELWCSHHVLAVCEGVSTGNRQKFYREVAHPRTKAKYVYDSELKICWDFLDVQ